MMSEIFERVSGSVDEKILVFIMLALVVVMFICGVVAIVTLDRDNEEMRMILEGLLREKQPEEESENREKNRCQK